MSCESPVYRLAVKMCSLQAMRDWGEPWGSGHCHQGHDTVEFIARFQKDGFWIASNTLEKKKKREKWIYFWLDKQYPSLQQILCKEPWCRTTLKEIDLPKDKWSLFFGISLRFLNELGEFVESISSHPHWLNEPARTTLLRGVGGFCGTRASSGGKQRCFPHSPLCTRRPTKL